MSLVLPCLLQRIARLGEGVRRVSGRRVAELELDVKHGIAPAQRRGEINRRRRECSLALTWLEARVSSSLDTLSSVQPKQAASVVHVIGKLFSQASICPLFTGMLLRCVAKHPTFHGFVVMNMSASGVIDPALLRKAVATLLLPRRHLETARASVEAPRVAVSPARGPGAGGAFGLDSYLHVLRGLEACPIAMERAARIFPKTLARELLSPQAVRAMQKSPADLLTLLCHFAGEAAQCNYYSDISRADLQSGTEISISTQEWGDWWATVAIPAGWALLQDLRRAADSGRPRGLTAKEHSLLGRLLATVPWEGNVPGVPVLLRRQPCVIQAVSRGGSARPQHAAAHRVRQLRAAPGGSGAMDAAADPGTSLVAEGVNSVERGPGHSANASEAAHCVGGSEGVERGPAHSANASKVAQCVGGSEGGPGHSVNASEAAHCVGGSEGVERGPAHSANARKVAQCVGGSEGGPGHSVNASEAAHCAGGSEGVERGPEHSANASEAAHCVGGSEGVERGPEHSVNASEAAHCVGGSEGVERGPGLSANPSKAARTGHRRFTPTEPSLHLLLVGSETVVIVPSAHPDVSPAPTFPGGPLAAVYFAAILSDLSTPAQQLDYVLVLDALSTAPASPRPGDDFSAAPASLYPDDELCTTSYSSFEAEAPSPPSLHTALGQFCASLPELDARHFVSRIEQAYFEQIANAPEEQPAGVLCFLAGLGSAGLLDTRVHMWYVMLLLHDMSSAPPDDVQLRLETFLSSLTLGPHFECDALHMVRNPAKPGY
ncbi:hypothetical protein DIPPA_20138 [Diplonema papillatum]|nr:hypothetical protein DIPPA_20138 [Diplonema papillatum]